MQMYYYKNLIGDFIKKIIKRYGEKGTKKIK